MARTGFDHTGIFDRMLKDLEDTINTGRDNDYGWGYVKDRQPFWTPSSERGFLISSIDDPMFFIRPYIDFYESQTDPVEIIIINDSKFYVLDMCHPLFVKSFTVACKRASSIIVRGLKLINISMLTLNPGEYSRRSEESVFNEFKDAVLRRKGKKRE